MSDWTHVQGVTSQSPAGNTLTKAFVSHVTSGDIVVGSVLLNTGYTASVTDDQSNSYTVFNSHDDGTLYTAAYYSNNLLTNSPITLTFTATGPSTTGNFWVSMDEMTPPSGAPGPISADGGSSVFSNAGTTFATFNTSLSDDLIFATAFSSGVSTHGSSFNAGTGDGTAVCSEWGIQSAAGSVTMNLASQSGNMWGPSFALNAGGGSPPVSQPSFASVRYLGWYAVFLLAVLALV